MTESLTAPGIWIVGLGPGAWSLLTVGALERVLAADEIYFRTLVHPTVEPLRARLRPEQALQSFDEHYERAASFDLLYEDIVCALIDRALAAAQPIVYAVPGHPLVGERTVSLLQARAPERGVAVGVVDGVSFLEPLLRTLQIDPLSSGLHLLDGASMLDDTAASLTAAWERLSPRLLNTGLPLVLGQVYDRRVATACKLWLLERYPGDHVIQVVMAAGTGESRVRVVALAELDHSAAFDHLTSLYVPPLDPLHDDRGIATLPYIAARLRAPDGCPWDRKQTWQSLKPHLLEEAYEAVAALDVAEPDAVAEELGDVLLLVTMIAQIGEEEGILDLPHVLQTVTGKLIRRHPHVFGDVSVDSSEAVVQNWERLKAGERTPSASALDGVPETMPALVASQVMQRKAASLGFDWADVSGVFAKLEEEIDEVRHADDEHVLEEVGDLLFAIVSLCRYLHLDAEEALRRANAKFRRRFGQVETLCAARGLVLTSLDAAAIDALWNEAKAAERA